MNTVKTMWGSACKAVGKASFFASTSAILAAAGAIGCSSFDPGDQSCVSLRLTPCDPPDEGNGANGGAGGTTQEVEEVLPEDWECLGRATSQTPAAMGTRITYRVAIVDFDSQPSMPMQVPGLVITVCGDANCSRPAGPELVTISNPTPAPFLYDIVMPYNFSNASLRLEAAGYTPMDYFFGGPMLGTPTGSPVIAGQTIAMLTTEARDNLYRGVGLPTPASAVRGDMAIRTLNCRRDAMGQTTANTRAADVIVEAVPENPPSAVAYSLSYGNLAFPNSPTDERGVAGFANLQPQNYQVRGLAPIGEEGMPFGQTGVAVRGGVITVLEIREGQNMWGQ
jgi:hypothetical protein